MRQRNPSHPPVSAPSTLAPLMARALARALALALLALAPAGLALGAPQGAAQPASQPVPDPVRVLFLGDQGHHKPADRAAQLIPVLAQRGVHITYTPNTEHLNPAMLNQYDGLIIYANTTKITPGQEAALLSYVEAGGGFIPLHCASYCFLNSKAYIDLVGAQFKRHGTGVFSVAPKAPEHDILQGFKGFESWDETYVHHRHNDKDRTILQTRREGDADEPWTWVRTQGKGRVFYTAWGHDERTWGNPGFQELVERGIRWATTPRVQARLQATRPRAHVPTEHEVPNYVASHRVGENFHTLQAPLSPEDSLRRLVTPPGLRAQLFASEPQVRKALAMTWDERGRLWLCESIDYPNELQPAGKGRDSIRICEDTDGDGKADRFTLFADKLSIPCAITPYRGGVIVQNGNQTEYLKDTDGDSKADLRKVLITGWGIGDTHGQVSHFQWGYDNWVWAMQGYNRSSPQFPGSTGQAFSQGFFRFKLDAGDPPSVTQLEFLRSTNNNTWGLGFSDENLVFGSTANRNPSVYLPIPNRYYERVRGFAPRTLGGIADNHLFYPASDRVRQVDHHAGYTAAAGHALYTARLYPKEYWNRAAFVNEPSGKLTGVFILERRGADFASSNLWNLAASDDEWCAPIMTEVGPDGCAWVLDWYNYIVQHNPTPPGFKTGRGNAYETPLRDKSYARVYRVVPADGKTDVAPRLDPRDPATLVAALQHSNRFWRLQAQRLLIERGQGDVAPALIALARDGASDELGLNVGVTHALWTLHGLGLLAEPSGEAFDAAIAALKHKAPGVRRNAAMVLPAKDASTAALLASDLLRDNDAQAALAGALALADMPTPAQADLKARVGRALLDALKLPRLAQDAWAPDALTAAAAAHDEAFLQAVIADHPAPAGTAAAPKAGDKPAPQRAAAVNLAPNPSGEEEKDAKPLHWRPVTYNGSAQFTLDAKVARTGSYSLRISSDRGADAGWAIDLDVKPRTRYRFSAYIKTDKLKKGSGRGAQLNIHEVQDAGASPAIDGSKDWTRISHEFDSGDLRRVRMNLLFGGWGQSTGVAWWDDVEFIEVADAASEGVLKLTGRGPEVFRIVAAHYAGRAPDSLPASLAALKGAEPRLASAFLRALAEGWPAGKAPQLSEADRAVIDGLKASLSDADRDALLLLARKWGRQDLFASELNATTSSLLATLADKKAPETARVEAARRLLELDDSPATHRAVLAGIDGRTPPSLAQAWVSALGASRNDDAADALLARWGDFTPSARAAAIAVTLRRPAWVRALLRGIESGKVKRSDLTASDWQLLKAQKDSALSALARKLDVASPSPDRVKVYEKLLPALSLPGDAARGGQLFTQLCVQCHALAGQGGKVGPDLTGIGVREAREILSEIVDPNRSVEANYRLWTVATTEGEQIAGRLDVETRTTVEVLDLTGKRHVVRRDDIASMSVSPLSIMPVGLIDALSPEDIASLMRHIREQARHAAPAPKP